jgi:hypothetical protein
LRKENNHISSQQVAAIALYSASAEDLEKVCCFLDFQDIRESPMKMQNPVTNFRVSTHPAQSESEKAFNWKLDFAKNKRP